MSYLAQVPVRARSLGKASSSWSRQPPPPPRTSRCSCRASTRCARQHTIDHSGGIFVFDPQGRLRLFMRPSMGVDVMAADVMQILKGA